MVLHADGSPAQQRGEDMEDISVKEEDRDLEVSL
jgi:hypothetical protein